MTVDDSEIEAAYVNGERVAYEHIISVCRSQLGYNQDDTLDRLIIERERVMAKLRDLCAEFGDNDWDDDLDLSDVLDKHLGRHLGSLN